MKNVFGIDVTEDKNNSRIDGECFITRRISYNTQEKINGIMNNEMDLRAEASLPPLLEIINTVCCFVGIIILVAVAETDFDIKKIVDNGAAYFLYIGVGAWVTFIYLTIYERKRFREVAESEELENHLKNMNEMIRVSMEELGIPEDSRSIDVIAVKYRYKDGKRKYVSFGSAADMVNFDMFVFVENGMLCLGDAYDVYEIPLSSIKGAERYKKRIMIPEWHKEEAFNSPTYKEYKVQSNNTSTYFTYCYRVTIEDVRGEFELIIPNYDMKTFSEITGMSIE